MKIALLLGLFFVPFLLSAQFYESIGAGNEALGHSRIAIQNSWSIFNNPAGYSEHEKLTGLASYRKSYLHPSFDQVAAGVLIPGLKFNTSLAFFHTGDNVLGTNSLRAGIASKVGGIRLGATASYRRVNMSEFGNIHLFDIDVNMITEVTKDLDLGMIFQHISFAQSHHLPFLLGFGLHYWPYPDLSIAMDVAKYLDADLFWTLGINYAFHQKLSASVGYTYNPNRFFMGLELELKKIIMAFSFGYQYAYGAHNQVSAEIGW